MTNAEGCTATNQKPPREVRSITPEEVLEICELLLELPSDELLEQAVTENQKQVGSHFRFFTEIVGACFFVRVNHLDGDPLRDLLLSKTPETTLLHTLSWTTVDSFEALYKLVQILWEPICQEFSLLDNPLISSYDLLLKLIEEHFNYCYESFLSRPKDEPEANARRLETVATATKTFFLTPDLLNQKQKKILEKERQIIKPPFLLSRIIAIADRDIKLHRNQAAKNQLSAYRYYIGVLFNSIGSYYRKYRKEGGFKSDTETSHDC